MRKLIFLVSKLARTTTLIISPKSPFYMIPFKEQIPIQPFFKWLFNNKENKILLLICFSITTIEFVWLKIAYYYPNFFHDSLDYINSAIENRAISYRPIGYSKFLQLTRLITTSHIFLVAIQYILLQLSILYFIFTAHYLLSLNKWLLRILLLVCIANPLVAHVSNLISSDALFTTLSLLWGAQLLWIIARPRLALLLIHALILLFAFTVRYNALYYPLFSIAVIFFSKSTLKEKLISTSFIIFLHGAFVTFTMLQFKKLTGTLQFAPFRSWQTVSNALAAYSYSTKRDDSRSFPPRFRKLHFFLTKDVENLRKMRREHESGSFFYYMWSIESPLFRYGNKKIELNYYKAPNFKKWSNIAPFYADYGLLLTKKHPVLYIRHFVLPNIMQYYEPSEENIGEYNVLFGNFPGPDVAYWFNMRPYYTDKRIRNIKIIHYCVTIHSIANLLLPLFLLGAIRGIKFNNLNKNATKSVCCMLLIWISNFVLNVISNPPVMRYLVFQLFITLALDILLLDFIIKDYYSIRKQQI